MFIQFYFYFEHRSKLPPLFIPDKCKYFLMQTQLNDYQNLLFLWRNISKIIFYKFITLNIGE